MALVIKICIIASILVLGHCSNFNVESYNLASNQARRHSSSIVSDNTLYLVGGINRYGPTSPNFEARRNIYKVNLDDDSPDWEFVNDIPSTDMIEPWFTTSRGMLEINKALYLACHDRKDGKIYSFDKEFGIFNVLSTMPFALTEDCCAVGLTVKIKDNTQFPPKTIKDDRIYITGGVMPTNNDPTNQVVYYSINDNQWYQVDSLNTGRSHHACSAVSDKHQTDGAKIYVIGGVDRTNLQVRSSMEVYNINDNEWTQYDNILNPARRSFGAITTPNNDAIILIGGDSRSPGDPLGADPLNLVQVLDITTNTIDNSAPQLNFARVSPATALLKKNDCDEDDGDEDCYSIFVVAGQDTNGVRADTERWDF